MKESSREEVLHPLATSTLVKGRFSCIDLNDSDSDESQDKSLSGLETPTNKRPQLVDLNDSSSTCKEPSVCSVVSPAKGCRFGMKTDPEVAPILVNIDDSTSDDPEDAFAPCQEEKNSVDVKAVELIPLDNVDDSGMDAEELAKQDLTVTKPQGCPEILSSQFIGKKVFVDLNTCGGALEKIKTFLFECGAYMTDFVGNIDAIIVGQRLSRNEILTSVTTSQSRVGHIIKATREKAKYGSSSHVAIPIIFLTAKKSLESVKMRVPQKYP